MTTTQFHLSRDAFGKLVLTDADGLVHHAVAPVRAFPVQAPDDGIALLSADGKEVGWIDHLADLAAPLRKLIEEELEGREFMPEIRAILDVTSFATPCTWHIETDRGATHFVLRGEEDLRRIGQTTVLVSDHHGIHFLIRDMQTLDRHSRKILDRFL